MYPNHRLTGIQSNRLALMVARRMNGEPIAYILGYKDFCGLRFKVNKHVLIPRPETEWLVDRIANDVVTKGGSRPSPTKAVTPVTILDLGTGSGCIAIMLAHKLADSRITFDITASDISPAALTVARSNAKTILGKKSNSLNYQTIRFVRSDLFIRVNGIFDVIVANLPYVPRKIYQKLHQNLKFEPKSALIDPKQDFGIYERFLAQVPEHVHDGSMIYLEIDPLARKVISQAVKEYLPGWKVKYFKDFRGLWRYGVISQSGGYY